MAITRDDVLHVAALARLELTEDEISRLEVQLNDILEAVGKVSELDLSDVPPTSHPLDVVNAFRPDEPRPSLPLADVLDQLWIHSDASGAITLMFAAWSFGPATLRKATNSSAV